MILDQFLLYLSSDVLQFILGKEKNDAERKSRITLSQVFSKKLTQRRRNEAPKSNFLKRINTETK